MGVRNLEKLHGSAQGVLKPFLEELIAVYGGEIISIFAYGSVTGQDYIHKSSDINISVVMEDVSPVNLKRCLAAVKKAMRNKISAPLFLSPSYVKMSLDVFPLEFTNIKDTRVILSGEDILSGIQIKREDIRKECEAQLKGRLLTIREAYLEQALDRKGVEHLVKASLKGLIPVFRGLVTLSAADGAPIGKRDIIAAVGREYVVNVDPFLEILNDGKSDGKIAGKSSEVFLGEFLERIETLCAIMDRK